MKRLTKWSLAGGVALSLLPGCRQVFTPTDFARPPLPHTVARPGIQVDLTRVGAPGDEPDPAAGTYLGLTAQDAQCRAARAAGIARPLEAELLVRSAQSSQTCLSREGARARAALYQKMLAYSIEDVRNRSAGGALELYYRLAEAEGQADILRSTVAELEDSLKRAEELRGKDLITASEVEALRRQLSEVRSEQVRARVGSEQANGQLWRLLGLDANVTHAWLWPETPPVVDPSPVDVEGAVAAGLASRPDLNLLRAVAACLNEDTIALGRATLAGTHPILGVSPEVGQPLQKCLMLLSPALREQAVVLTYKQLLMVLEDKERQVAGEIRQNANLLDLRAQAVARAQATLEIAERRVNDLEEEKKKGLSVQTALGRARLDALKARSDVLKAAVDWEVARAQLRQAQGVLARECADAPPGPLTPCSGPVGP